MRQLLFFLCSLAITGCSNQPKTTRDESVLALDKIPPTAMKAAQEKLPDVKFDSAWKVGEDRFEIRGKTATGKIRDVQVSTSGEILEVD